jgi:hypothetical protein
MYEPSKRQPLPEELQHYHQFIALKAYLAHKRYIKRLLWVTLIALVTLSGYLLYQRPASVSIEKAFLALGITWVGFLPSLQYLLDRNRPPMPFFPLVGIFYATSFGLPIFASNQFISDRWSLTNVTSTALSLTLLGLIGMNMAFFISKYSLFKRLNPIRLPSLYPVSRLRTLLWIMLVLHLAFLYVPTIQKIPSLGQLLDPIGYVAYGMFYIIYSRKKLPTLQCLLLIGICFPLEVIPRFTSGSLAQIMLLCLFMIMVVWYENKKIPIVFIMITLLFFVTFNSVKSEYRYLVWFGKGFQLSTIEKVHLFIELAIDHYHSNDFKSQKRGSVNAPIDSIISRTAHIILFSNVVEDTPARVPYWGGETYLPLLTSYIPRALFPGKPIENTGNRFGRRYQYLNSNDFITSYNLPWIVEMYANFGAIGVFIGMPSIGLMLAFLEQKINNPEMSSLEVVIGNTILFNLIYQESNLSLMTGSIFNLTLALYLLFKVSLAGKIKLMIRNADNENY